MPARGQKKAAAAPEPVEPAPEVEAEPEPEASSHRPSGAARPSDETRPARGIADVEEGHEPTSEERRGIA